MSEAEKSKLAEWAALQARTLDEQRPAATQKRHAAGFRTARENLAALVDPGSFVEYGQLAVAAQRQRYDYDSLLTNTAADGVITGLGSVNGDLFGPEQSRAVVIVNDYSVLAGTQGFFHHHKLDRILHLAGKLKLPVIMFTEGGGGRPGDVDVATSIAGLNTPSFYLWAKLGGLVPRIAVNNGYCFAGNAALFGCADITIATRSSWIGMAGPAMIEGGSLGKFAPTEIGPVEMHAKTGGVDLVAQDEAAAAALAKKLLSYFQGPLAGWSCPDQQKLRDLIPANRRRAYDLRKVIVTLADEDSFVELRSAWGRGLVTGFLRLAGRPLGLMANNCWHLGGAVDADAADKASRFLQLCDAHGLPILSLIDTPGFMVGPASEEQAAVRRMSGLFASFASVSVPIVAILLRKGYGLGAMAMAGGSFLAPDFIAAWPTGEIGAMGLEGAVTLGFRKELAALEDEAEKQALFDRLVGVMYQKGKATEAAAFLELDAVIDPADTRAAILQTLDSAGQTPRRAAGRRKFIDTW
ncbi:MAG: biotin carboxylase [Deltaproteobacteria bacterium]|nr:biotin carboxylase [Deltaproteobacteria bacterium]